MCSPTHSVGLSQDRGENAAGVGSLASHELGHNMNMKHDDARTLALERLILKGTVEMFLMTSLFFPDRKSVVYGKSVDIGGSRII